MTTSASRTPFDVVFFDFDGTLVRSAEAKRDAFFSIFPDTPAHRAVIERTLAEDPDGSRHVVIPRMIEAMRTQGLEVPPGDFVEAYGMAALSAVAACPAMPGAEALLKALQGRVRRVVFSNTPHEPLQSLIEGRGWESLMDELHGYPARKADIIRTVLARLGTAPERAAVTGDGVSDEAAARETGAAFFPAGGHEGLAPLAEALGLVDVR
ncbi:MAG: HAD family hydrolase [Parvibaculaceae bacterium]